MVEVSAIYLFSIKITKTELKSKFFVTKVQWDITEIGQNASR